MHTYKYENVYEYTYINKYYLCSNNDRSAIMSRIDYIERNEPCRSFLKIF